jgi:hypothetical protein
MTTASWSSGNQCTTDAEFRVVGSEYAAKLAAVGLVQTADTGQINWATVLRPTGGLANGGYEIWRFNDAMQATAPIFLKVWYGTGTPNTNCMRIYFETGTATNGAGTLSGTGSGVGFPLTRAETGTGSATATTSYLCHTAGFFGSLWKVGNAGQGFAGVARTVDSTGVPDATGLLMWGWGQVTNTTGWLANLRIIRFASPASVIYSNVYASASRLPICIAPGVPSPSTLPSGDKQAYICWGSFPDLRPVNGLAAVLTTEFPGGTTYSAAMVGPTVHTYLSTGVLGTGVEAISNSYTMAMLWE